MKNDFNFDTEKLRANTDEVFKNLLVLVKAEPSVAIELTGIMAQMGQAFDQKHGLKLSPIQCGLVSHTIGIAMALIAQAIDKDQKKGQSHGDR